MADLSPTATDLVTETESYGFGTLGEAADAGDLLFKDDDDLWYLADATDNTKPAANEQMAITISGGTTGQPVLLYSAHNKYIDMGSILTKGEIYVSSATAGKIAPKSDLVSTNYLVIVGYAKTTNQLILKLDRTGVQL